MCCFDVTVNSSLGGLEVVAHVERSDVLYALLAATLTFSRASTRGL